MTDKELMRRVLSMPLADLIIVRRMLVEEYGIEGGVITKIDAQIDKARRANAMPVTHGPRRRIFC